MAQTKSPPAEKKAWTLTFAEYKQTPQALLVPKESVLAVSLEKETLESLLRFKIKELSALARIMDARGSGKKAVIIASILLNLAVSPRMVTYVRTSLPSYTSPTISPHNSLARNAM